MLILGVDTSCDDTSIAVLEAGAGNRFELLSNIVSSQVEIHKKYGGVYPLLARRAHQQNLPKVLDEAFAGANVGAKDIDAISVTIGPGLDPCLWTGLNFVRALALKWGIPIIPVNHIEGHILANWLTPRVVILREFSRTTPSQILRTGSESPDVAVDTGSRAKQRDSSGSSPQNDSVVNSVKFPAICLVVSGGHTQLILMKKIGKYEILGETRDDAAGECFDKTARILGLGYPGGPAIAEQALLPSLRGASRRRGNPAIQLAGGDCRVGRSAELPPRNDSADINLPRPMLYTKDYDFSFSGLKTAVLYDYKKRISQASPLSCHSERALLGEAKNLPPNYIQAMSAEIQQAIIDVLLKKTIKASRDYKVKTIMLGGGVVANQELRTQFQSKIQKDTNFALQIPDLEFCQDNGAMIAITGWFNRAKAIKSARKIQTLKPLPNLRI